MKKYLILLTSLLLLNCTKKRNEKTYYNNIKREKITPIFLNLSPKMSSKEFNDSLKINPEIINDKFLLRLNNYNCEFDISKRFNQISLIHSRNYDSKANIFGSLYQIFKNKYGKPITLPVLKKGKNSIYSNKNNSGIIYPNGVSKKILKDYGYNLNNYYVFKDSIKTVLIGGSSFIYKPEYSQFTERDIAELSGIKDLNNYSDTPKIIVSYDTTVEINYISNSDFEKVTDKMISDDIIFKKTKREFDSIKKNKKQGIINNSKKI